MLRGCTVEKENEGEYVLREREKERKKEKERERVWSVSSFRTIYSHCVSFSSYNDVKIIARLSLASFCLSFHHILFFA